jgi:hypothetical protein
MYAHGARLERHVPLRAHSLANKKVGGAHFPSRRYLVDEALRLTNEANNWQYYITPTNALQSS